MNKKLCGILIAILLVLVVILTIIFKPNYKQEELNSNTKIVTSFYPIYIIASNIVQDANNVELINMTEANVGCVHNYTLLASDMKKIEDANIFIKSGLELENFMDKIVSTYPNLKVIDSSRQIPNKIQETEGVNPHIWTSITNYIKQVEEVSTNLCQYNQENADIYTINTKNYINSLNELKEQYNNQLQNLKGKKAICLNEALIYLTQEVGMEITQVETDHEESTLSADTLKNLINKMKQEEIEVILVDVNDNLRNAQTLSLETGAKIYKLNSCLTGENNKDSYINNMKQNLEVLKQIQ